jgi:sugar transferase (PEP-CTERM system associated)
MLRSELGNQDTGLSYDIVAYLAANGEDTVISSNRVQTVTGPLLDFALANEVDEIVVALDDRRNRLPSEELLACRLAGVLVLTPATFLEREQDKLSLEMLSPDWLIFSSGFNRQGFQSFLQRSFDVVSSVIILLLMAPLLSIVAVLIAAESKFRAPIFYTQERVGLAGKPFNLIKFRSMRVDAEADGKAVWARQNDNRITRVGHFIRQTRIDELPQILNILKGDMRLVGPRPERPEFVEGLSKRIPYYNQRHTVKPGLAGWAQLKYPYGATEKDAREKLRFDMYYVKNHNLVMDIFILIQTVEVVLFGKGAR